MCKSLFYVGVDVGKDQLCISIEGYRPREFRHDAKGVRSLLNWISKNAADRKPHFCMESTGVYSRCLAVRLLSFKETEVSIVNPAQINSYAKAQLRRTKTDGVDSRVILSFAQSQKPAAWEPEPEAVSKLYHLVSQADVLKQQLQDWSNRQHAHSYATDLPKEVRSCDKAVMRALERQRARIEKAIDDLLEENQRLASDVKLLCSFKGVAKETAVRVIGYGRNAMTERSARALVAHAGLAPRHHESGNSVHGKSHIAKQGDKRLRKTLYMPALVAIVHNPVIKTFYLRLLKKGKPKKLALTACMKKILLILRAILKTRIPFNPNLIPTPAIQKP